MSLGAGKIHFSLCLTSRSSLNVVCFAGLFASQNCQSKWDTRELLQRPLFIQPRHGRLAAHPLGRRPAARHHSGLLLCFLFFFFFFCWKHSSQSRWQLKSRIGHSMLLHDKTRSLYIFGGQRGKDYLSDFYVFDIGNFNVSFLFFFACCLWSWLFILIPRLPQTRKPWWRLFVTALAMGARTLASRSEPPLTWRKTSSIFSPGW